MEVDIRVIDAMRFEGRRSRLQAMNFVAFCVQEFRQVRAILACDAGNQGFRHVILFDSLALLLFNSEQLAAFAALSELRPKELKCSPDSTNLWDIHVPSVQRDEFNADNPG